MDVLLCRGWFDLSDDSRSIIDLNNDLISNLAPMDLNVAREVECHADTFALDTRNADNADRVLGVPDDDFFTFSTCDDQHPLLTPNYGSVLSRLGEYTTLWDMSKRILTLKPRACLELHSAPCDHRVGLRDGQRT